MAISASSHYESDGAVDFVAGASGVLRRIEPEWSNDGPYEADEYWISIILHGLQPRSCVGDLEQRMHLRIFPRTMRDRMQDLVIDPGVASNLLGMDRIALPMTHL